MGIAGGKLIGHSIDLPVFPLVVGAGQIQRRILSDFLELGRRSAAGIWRAPLAHLGPHPYPFRGERIIRYSNTIRIVEAEY